MTDQIPIGWTDLETSNIPIGFLDVSAIFKRAVFEI
jgi:hypothetical protein